jgi:gliding motility-associated-like protein
MKKIFIIIFTFLIFNEQSIAQQLKRWTLSSVGTQKVQAPVRMSWTAGSACVGCGTMKSTDGKTSVRQGFQQSPEINNNPAGCLITSSFEVSTISTQSCGPKFDFQFTGIVGSGMTIEWNFGEGAFPSTSNQTNPVSISYLTAGNKAVTMTVKKDGCTNSSAKIIEIKANQTSFGATVNVNNIKCYGDKTGILTLSTFGGTGLKTFKWSNGGTSSSISNLSVGKYQATITDANGCSFVIDTTISQPINKISLKDTVISETCKGYSDGNIRITPSGGTLPYQFIWSNGKKTAFVDSLTTGKYQLRVIDAQNCAVDSSYEIRTRCRDNGSDKIFDTFSPNGDNVNEYWIVKDILKHPKNELIIYNRWGQIVYNKAPYANEWNGLTNDGKELPTAAYYYVIRLNDDDATVLTGSITLVR